jgi:two-component system chemotaxis response regulator CheB
VLVMQHLEPGRRSDLAYILGQRTELAVREAAGGAVLARGTVYVAPAGRHLRVGAGHTLSLTHTAQVHHSRPSADVLLGSLAQAGVPMVAVVLTAMGRDGAAGSLRGHRRGVDQALPLGAIAHRVLQLLQTPNAPYE